MIDSTKLTSGPHLDGLMLALKRLDSLLERAVAAAQIAYGPEAASSRFRGLYIDQDEIKRLLAREPGAPAIKVDEPEEPLATPLDDASMMAWLKEAFGLSPFEIDVILIVLAPELDLRYERLYAYLQDDVTRKRPTIDLALNLLCTSIEEKLSRRIHFASDSPLIRHRLLHMIAEPNHVQPPLLAHYLKLDEQIVRMLLGQNNLDSRLTPFCRRIEATVPLKDQSLNDEMEGIIAALAIKARKNHQALRLYFHGPHGTGRLLAANVLASKIGRTLLLADIQSMLNAKVDLESLFDLLFREAWLQNTILYLDGLDLMLSEDQALHYKWLLESLGKYNGITILAGTRPWSPSKYGPKGIIPIPFSLPDFGQRRAYWESTLTTEGISIKKEDLY